MLARLAARLALAQLGTADTQQLQNPPAEQGAGTEVGPGHVDLFELRAAIREDLQWNRGRIEPGRDAGLYDFAGVRAELLHRDWRNTRHRIRLTFFSVTEKTGVGRTRCPDLPERLRSSPEVPAGSVRQRRANWRVKAPPSRLSISTRRRPPRSSTRFGGRGRGPSHSAATSQKSRRPQMSCDPRWRSSAASMCCTTMRR